MATLAQLQNGELQGIQRLQISEGLSHFPTEIFELADTLEILDLSGNCLSQLPDDLNRLYKLKIIFCSNNQFTELPAVLGSCLHLTMVGFKSNQIHTVSASALPSALRWLILTDNKILQLPEELGNCNKLQKLMLSGNCLSNLPLSLSNCSNLELIRFASNQLVEFPKQLLKLPRLAWLAFADNPFCLPIMQNNLAPSPIQRLSWQNVRLGDLLGQGASGSIYEALIETELEGGGASMALKVFKGTMTSDGQPQSEIDATLLAGSHDHLIKVSGQIDDHPEGLPVLVMEKLSADFSALAHPPSLETCTRDVYADNLKLNFAQALKILRAVATTVAHLHQKSILHGDLYAHNILINSKFDCILSDLGAATYCLSLEPAVAFLLQKCEVKAFGNLIDELIDRVRLEGNPFNTLSNGELKRQLELISQQCHQLELAQRPSFVDITQRLLAIPYQ